MTTTVSPDRRQTRGLMRRHHFLSLGDTDHPPDNISLLIGAEADQKRWRSTPIPHSPGQEMHRRLHSVFGGTVPGDAEGDGDSPKDEEDQQDGIANSGVLGRVHSYSRLMHAHTKSQLARPSISTLPSYQKTMHAFTLNQLDGHWRVSLSEASSPHVGAPLAIAPPKLNMEQLNLIPGEVPPAPGNTPEIGATRLCRGENHVQGIDFRKLKRRSLTDPEMVRSLAAGVMGRDFASKL